MRNKTHLSTFVIILVCGLLVALPFVSLAQHDTTPTETTKDTGPEGYSLLMLLVGLVGVTLVGGVMIGRDTFKGETDEPRPR